MRSATSQLSSLYRFLWGIPLRGRLLAPAAAAYAAASITLSLLGGAGPYAPIILAGFASSLALGWILERSGMDLGMINLRRLNQLAIVNSFFLFLGLATSLAIPGSAALAAMMALSSFIRGAVFHTLSGRSVSRATPFLALMLLLEAAPTFLLRDGFYAVSISKGYLIGFALSLLLVLVLKRLILIKGAPAIDYVSSVLAYLLDDRRDWIRELVGRLDDEGSVELSVLVFRGAGLKPEAAIIVPRFHLGPFKDFGSSGLIYRIYEELRRGGVKAIFFKGFSNHHDNLILEDDCALILKKVKDVVLNDHGKLSFSPYSHSPIPLSEDHVKGLLLGIGDAKMLLVTTHPMGMEDIPNRILECVHDPFLIPVDCHNSFVESVRDLDEESLQKIANLLRKAERIEFRDRVPLVFGCAQTGFDGYRREDGAGDLGVSAAVFIFDGRPSAIVSLDGNNCLPRVRDEVVDRLKRLGFEFVEISTTDTHIVNGLRFGGRGYHPLGEKVPAEFIAEKAVEAVKRALNDAKPMEAAWIKLRFPGVRVMSQSFLEEAAAKTRQGVIAFFLFLVGSLAAAILL